MTTIHFMSAKTIELKIVECPWNLDQVESLNRYQDSGVFHPYTTLAHKNLIATELGWVEEDGGPIVQTWAHSFTCDWSWLEAKIVNDALRLAANRIPQDFLEVEAFRQTISGEESLKELPQFVFPLIEDTPSKLP